MEFIFVILAIWILIKDEINWKKRNKQLIEESYEKRDV